MRRLIRPETDKSRGAAAVMVGAALVALLGATGLAVDVGNYQATRNRSATAADAGALAASQKLSDGETETAACAEALTHVTTNEPNATMTSCITSVASTGQTVITVQVQETVDYVFAEVMGFSSGTVTRTSTARYGLLGVQGARPFGLCMETLGNLLVGWDSLGTASIGPVQVPYTKINPADCNGGSPVPGNWGSLDFNGGSNGTPEQIDWIENGYSGTVQPGDAIEGNPGAMSNSVASGLDSLIASAEEFPVPIFGTVSGTGSNAIFNIIGFVTAQLVDYKVNGSSSSRYLEFVFVPGQWPGIACCDINGTSVNLFASGICAHSDDTDAC